MSTSEATPSTFQHPWVGKLITEQKDQIEVISDYAQYTIDWQQDIDNRMSKTPLISMDTESKKGHSLPFPVQIAFAHSPYVLVFKLDDLKGQNPSATTVVDLLPTHLVQHLQISCTHVLVCGDESQPFGTFHGVDIQRLFILYKETFFYHDERNRKDYDKTGLAIIGMIAGDYTHKPIDKDTDKDWFAHLI